MKDFIVVHYDGNNTNLTYTDTENDARAYLVALITTHQVAKNDTLSIVRAYDDSLIYFKRRNNTVKSVLGNTSANSINWIEFWTTPFQDITTKLHKKIANLGVVFGIR
ncbi:hypothetical protein GCM10027299_54140 [Larkinella ripae]